MSKYLTMFLSVPRSLIVNIVLFGIRGIRIPLLISWTTKIRNLKRGNVALANYHFGTVKFGIREGSSGVDAGKSLLSFADNSCIFFEGKANFAKGSKIILSQNGKITIGDGFSCNKNCCFSSDDSIQVGKDVLLGWNVDIRTSDGHTIFHKNDETKAQINTGGGICWKSLLDMR